MKIGSVFYWADIDKDDFGRPKGRWFIILGTTGYGYEPSSYHVGTTTTQLQHFEKDGARHRHLVCYFSSGEGGFTESCALDIDEDIFAVEAAKVDSDPRVQEKGTLPASKLMELYARIKTSAHIPRIVKGDIYQSFQNVGIQVTR